MKESVYFVCLKVLDLINRSLDFIVFTQVELQWQLMPVCENAKEGYVKDNTDRLLRVSKSLGI